MKNAVLYWLMIGAGLSCLARCAVSASNTDELQRESSEKWGKAPPENPVIRLVSRIEIGPAERYRGLVVHSLFLRGTGWGSGVKTLDEAVNHGWITIREKDDAEVPVVLVRNDSRHHVFLMSGEIIAGGKQNRMVKEDVLLPPSSGFVGIPVYCGERGRWVGRSDVFESAGILAHAGLRKMAAAQEPQTAIWSEIEGYSARLGVRSPTHDYRRTYDDTGVREKLDECVRRFRDLPRPSTVGLVALAGDVILGCDIFSDSELCAKLWEKLIRSYAAEAIGDGRGGSDRPSARVVRKYLEQLYKARYRERLAVGEGHLLVVSDGIRGTALVWQGEVVHLGLFGDAEYRPLPSPPPDQPIPRRRWEEEP
ncbi:MAG: hypothetical protein N2255_09290 [Kiritimatiellae bacterium]|nr:hypothetical protein [Kiritimatiellia bacterium]